MDWIGLEGVVLASVTSPDTDNLLQFRALPDTIEANKQIHTSTTPTPTPMCAHTHTRIHTYTCMRIQTPCL